MNRWILAARPKTLSGAAVPVMVAASIFYGSQDCCNSLHATIIILLCFLFAFLMQIDANFINDYYDCKRGTDREDRLGPPRACAQGWITLSAMRRAIIFTTIAACLTGLPMILYGGWWMIAIGAACVCFAILYTTWLSYIGLGDVLVVVFFGLVPICTTYWLLTAPEMVPWHVVYAALAVGIVTDTLLVLNNFRDREQDLISGKVTLIVRIGEKCGSWLYLILGIIACGFCLPLALAGWHFAALLPLLYLIPHYRSWRNLVRIWKGRELNNVLGETARNILLFGILLSVGFLLGNS